MQEQEPKRALRDLGARLLLLSSCSRDIQKKISLISIRIIEQHQQLHRVTPKNDLQRGYLFKTCWVTRIITKHWLCSINTTRESGHFLVRTHTAYTLTQGLLGFGLRWIMDTDLSLTGISRHFLVLFPIEIQ